jgi:predicted dehydrogenase
VPKQLDYNMWLGQAPKVPYHPMRCHYSFRFLLAHSGGQMTNWGAHYLDIAQWGIGADNSGPLTIDGKGKFPNGGLFTAAEEGDITYTYADDVTLILSQRKGNSGNIRFEGSEGWISVNRKRMEAEPNSLLSYNTKPNELHLTNSLDHKQNFLDCIKTRQQPIANAEIGHRSASVCHLGNISMLLGRKLAWNPKKEQFASDGEANSMVSRVMRSPWHL